MSFLNAKTTGLSFLDNRNQSMKSGLGPKKDMRPLGTKNWQEISMRNLTQFLISRGFPHSLSSSSLKKPQHGEFASLMKFMIHEFDPDFELNPKKFEEDIEKFLKSIGYPYTLNKSVISSLTSQQTWATLLGAIVWLMDGLKFLENFNLSVPAMRQAGGPAFLSSTDDSGNSCIDGSILPNSVRQYLLTTFKIIHVQQFRKSTQQEDDDVQKELRKRLEGQQAMVEQERGKISDLEKQILLLEREGCDEDSIRRQLQEIDIQIAQEQEQLTQLENRRLLGVFAELREAENALAEAQQQVNDFENEVARLEGIVKSQPCSQEQFLDLEREVTALKSQVIQSEHESWQLNELRAYAAKEIAQLEDDLQQAMLNTIRSEVSFSEHVHHAQLYNIVGSDIEKVKRKGPNLSNVELRFQALDKQLREQHLQRAINGTTLNTAEMKKLTCEAVCNILGFDWKSAVKTALIDINVRLVSQIKAEKVKGEQGAEERSRCLRALNAKGDELEWAIKNNKDIESKTETRDLELRNQITFLEDRVASLKASEEVKEGQLKESLLKAEMELKITREQCEQRNSIAQACLQRSQKILEQDMISVAEFKSRSKKKVVSEWEKTGNISLEVENIIGDMMQRSRSAETRGTVMIPIS